MFWGITCESGKRYSQIPSEPFRVSMAALEPRDKIPENRFVSLMLEHKGKEFLLCTLEYERSLQVNLNLEFGQGEEMFFFINGEGTIHLSGYLNAAPISPMPPQLVEESASYLYSCNASKAGAAASRGKACPRRRYDRGFIFPADDYDDEAACQGQGTKPPVRVSDAIQDLNFSAKIDAIITGQARMEIEINKIKIQVDGLDRQLVLLGCEMKNLNQALTMTSNPIMRKGPLW